MKRNFNIFIAAVVAMVAISCAKEELNIEKDPVKMVKQTLYAYTDDGLVSKTQLDGLNVVWNEGDEITAFGTDGKGYNAIVEKSAIVDEEKEGTLGQFTFAVPEGTTLVTAVYPSGEGYTYDGEYIYAELPSVQPAVKDNFADGVNLALANVTYDTELQQYQPFKFSNATGLLCLGVNAEEEALSNLVGIQLYAKENTGEHIAGGVMAGLANNEVTCLSDAEDGFEVRNIISLNADSFEQGDYYFCALPGNYGGENNRMKITFFRKDGKVAPYTNPNQLELGVNDNIRIGNLNIPATKWRDNLVLDLSIDETSTANADEISWDNPLVSVSATEGTSTTAANNYYPGTSGKTYTSTRFYTGSTLTITPKGNISIAKIEFSATSDSYANAFGGATIWTNASVKSNVDKLVTIVPTVGTNNLVANIGGTCGFDKITIYFGEPEGHHTITIDEDIPNGSISASSERAFAGEIITLNAIPDEGYEHDTWVVKCGNDDVTVENSKFTMPDGDVTVSATFKERTTPQPQGEVEVFYESFDNNNGTGANDNKGWSGNVASSTIQSINSGWTFTKGNGAYQCAKFGTGSALGSAETPEIDFQGAEEATLTFKAGLWSGDLNDGLIISATNASVSPESVTLADGKWSNYEIAISEVKGKVKIKFEASSATKNRFFLDEVKVVTKPVKILTGIEISGTPKKTSYRKGDTFDPSGLVVTGTYDDKSTAEISEGITWTFDPETLIEGTSSVNVTATVGEESDSYEVGGISVATFTSISVKTKPNKVEYTEGEKFDPTGLVITKNWSDNTQDEVAYNNTTKNDFSFIPSIETALKTTDDVVSISYAQESVNQNITVTAIPVLTSIEDIFTAAKEVLSSVKITFNNWVISGVTTSNAYITDNDGKGFIIYSYNHGFSAGDVLNGTVKCGLTTYSGAAEVIDVTSTSEGLTVTKGGEITPKEIDITGLSGVNIGAVISLSGLTYDSSNKVLSDGENTIKPYGAFMTLPQFSSDNTYNITGIYIQYNDIKEIAPRSSGDVVEILPPFLTVTPSEVNIPSNASDVELTVNSNVEWEVETSDDTNYSFSVDVNKIIVSVTENESTENPRSGVITVKATNGEVADQTVTITQEKKVTPYLTAEADKNEVDVAGGTVEITVGTNIPGWGVASSDPTNFSAAVNGNIVTVTVTPATEARTGKITILSNTDGVNNVEISISQEKGKYSKTFSYGLSGWSLTNYTDQSTYYQVPTGDNVTYSVATLKDVFKNKTATGDVVVTINSATYGTGGNPTSETFKIYTTENCSQQVTATQGGTLPTSSSYTDVTYTISKNNSSAFINDLFLKITKPGKTIRLKSIKVEFEYTLGREIPTPPVTPTKLSTPTDLSWDEDAKTLSWTNTNSSNGTYGTDYKYQYRIGTDGSWTDATSETTAVLTITETKTVYVKAVAINTTSYNDSGVSDGKSCTISGGQGGGGPYTITFATGSGDGTSASTSTACSTVVSDGSDYLLGNLATASTVYYCGDYGLKLGSSKNAGTIKMNLSTAGQVTPTSIVVNAKLYNSGKATTLKVNGSATQNLAADFADYTFNITGKITYIELVSSKYCWIKSVTVNY